MNITTILKNMWTGFEVLVTLGLVGALISIISEFFRRSIFTLFRDEKEEGIEDRIKKLTSALTQSTKFISQIEEEIKKRAELADRLKADVDRYKKLCSVRSDEVEAIAQTLRFELQKEGRKSFWSGVFVNAIFFVVGAITSYFISKLLK
jgi:hypothetical protein